MQLFMNFIENISKSVFVCIQRFCGAASIYLCCIKINLNILFKYVKCE